LPASPADAGSGKTFTVRHPPQLPDDTVHQRVRLGVLAVLAEADQADFAALQQLINAVGEDKETK
jgi:hypothetical protein